MKKVVESGGQNNYNLYSLSHKHRNLIYIECSSELEHILAAKTVAL
jgi:hypothetical protein